MKLAHGRIAWIAAAGLAISAFAQNTTTTQPAAPAGSKPAAQPTSSPATTPTSTGTPAPKVKFPEPVEPGPYVKQTDISYWAFKMMVRMYRNGEQRTQEGKIVNFQYELPFETATVVFPLIPDTSSASLRLSEARGTLRLGGQDFVDGKFVPASAQIPTNTIPRPPEILERHYTGAMYHSGTRLAKFAAGEIGVQHKAESVSFLIDLPMQTSNTEFDEANAIQVPWPKGPWPEAAQMTFAPQQWVDFETSSNGQTQRYNEQVFQNLIKRWLNGKDPKKDFTPVLLAKTLMGGMVKDIRQDRNELNYRLERPLYGNDIGPNNTQLMGAGAYMVGMQVRGAEYAASAARGASEWDTAALGCAIFRRCGLPTRLVVGYDKREQEEKEEGKNLKPDLRAWFEFYLFDEVNNTGNWVICDPYRMRNSMNQAPPIHNKWKYFGNHDEMESVMPVALHFMPPTNVVGYGAPAFWGWWITPQTPTNAQTAITMTARKTSVPKDAPKNRDNKGRPFKQP